MTGASPNEGGPVRPATALAFATAAFVALVIFALGMLSLVLGEDVVETPGLGQVPGVVATASAVVTFAVGLWLTLRRAAPRPPAQTHEPRSEPSYVGAIWIALATALVYVGALWLAAVATGADLAAAAAVAGRIATGWFGVAVLLSALVCAWGGIALVRTRARRPRWPWEGDDDA